MTNEQVTKVLEGLPDEQLVTAIATGKQILETRFAAAAKQLADDQKRMLATAISGRKRARNARKEVGGQNVISKAAGSQN